MINLDKIVKKVLSLIEKNGFEAYVVGGYIRDLILNRVTYDVDICTNALPKDIVSIFKNCDVTKYGNVFFKIKKYDFTVTTYRKEISYENRRPKNVIYINNLIEDLKRRDFTINAICINKNDLVIDLLNGYEDLNNHVIRMIGNPSDKLKEDPLRILRAIRFATILGFEIDEKLSICINQNYKLIKNISLNRTKDEIDKILLSENAIKGINLLREYNILEFLNIKINKIVRVNNLLGMWAQIDFSDDIPFTKEDKNNIINLKKILKKGVIDNFILYEYGLYLSMVAGEILNIDKGIINKLYKNLPLHSTKDLCLTFEEVINFLELKEKSMVGKIVNDLVKEILNGNLSNSKRNIYIYLSKYKGVNV